MKKIRVTIWNEYRHEKTDENVRAIYPNGLHAKIKEMLSFDGDLDITLAALDDPDQGLPQERLDNTDVLIWWGHMSHGDVDDALVDRIAYRVINGAMGFIALHSAHESKPFRRIIGTAGNLSWGSEQHEIIWNLFPNHPIASGIPSHFALEQEEMYGEPFLVAQPDELVFGSWFQHGNIFRSGMCFYRGVGRIFYFQPGHESVPTYHNETIIKIIDNAIHWAAPVDNIGVTLPTNCPCSGDVDKEFGF